ncbi:MAG: DUF3500 domain-containing protein [Akkermansiaceae bacterium]
MKSDSCPDCSPDSAILSTRRSFIQKAGLAAGAIGAGGILSASGKPVSQKPKSETLVKTFYDSLNEEQRKKICFDFDHKLRLEVDNNWYITKTMVKDFSKDQQAMIKEIFMGLHSEEYAQKVYDQVEWDSGKDGFDGGSSVAIFGEPGTGKFEFVLTGRHCTRRCDGDSSEGVAFGGPLFYGHAAKGFREGPKHEGNAYWYQAVRANEVYQMLDGKQRKIALLNKSRGENGLETVKLSGKKEGLAGIRVADLARDQKDHVGKVLADLFAPFRKQDADEALKYVKEAGMDNLHLSFYKGENIGDDEVWDVWQLEGPNMISYFRGKPHVHAWLHVRKPV